MTGRPRDRTRLGQAVILICFSAWILLLVMPGLMMGHAHDPNVGSGHSHGTSHMPIGTSPLALGAGWFLMLIAMMSPSLIAPLQHVAERSFKHRRARSLLLFSTGYTAIWMMAGLGLLSAAIALGRLSGTPYLPAIGIGLIALVWQCSPIKQRCLNRNHNHRELAAFGTAADLDILRFGSTHGVWCVGSCWALMLFPYLLPQGHLAAMASVTLIMVSERLEQPRAPSWRLKARNKLARIAVAQARIQLQRLSAGPLLGPLKSLNG